MKLKKIGLAVAMVATMAMTAACGNGSGDSESTSAATPVESSSEVSVEEKPTIGIVRFASSDPASESIINAYVDYAEAQGWDVSSIDPQGAPDKAISGIQNYVQKGVDLIVVSIFPSDNLAAGVLTAEEAGIPVISIGGGITKGVQASLDFGRSNAVDTTKQLIADMGGAGELLVFGYQSGKPCVGREEELMAQLEGTDIVITREEVTIPGQVEAATKFTQAWLAKHPEGSGKLAVWGCFGDPALGALAALRQAERTDVLVYGHDGAPAVIQAVSSGDLRATSFFDPAAEGETLAKGTPGYIKAGVGATPQDLSPTMYLVMQDTMADFLAKFPQAAG